MDIKKVLSEFDISPTLIEELEHGGVNADLIYKITTENESFFLKSIRESLIEQTENSAELVRYIVANGFKKAPLNIKTKNNLNILRDVEGHNWELQEFVEGKLIDDTNLTIKNCEKLGKTIATLHKIFLNDKTITELPYVSVENSYIEMFDGEQHERMVETINKAKKLKLPKDDDKLLEKYWEEYQTVRNNLLVVLEKSDEDKFTKSLIHRDINKGNILFEKNGEGIAAIIDWENGCYGNVIQDIAYVLSQYVVNKENKGKLIDKVNSFMEGYESTVKLKEEEKAFIPILAEILLTRATRWWGKRYIQLAEEGTDLEKLNQIKGGFRKTLINWLDGKDNNILIFKEVFKNN